MIVAAAFFLGMIYWALVLAVYCLATMDWKSLNDEVREGLNGKAMHHNPRYLAAGTSGAKHYGCNGPTCYRVDCRDGWVPPPDLGCRWPLPPFMRDGREEHVSNSD